MTTFTTQDRMEAEKVNNLEVLEPIPFIGMVQIAEFEDLLIPNTFSFRFFKEGTQWVCRMDDTIFQCAKQAFERKET